MAYIFLTGATGFVGSFVAQELVAQKHDVICLVRSTSDRRWLQGLPLNFCIGSFTELGSYLGSLKKCDYVIHVAGVTSARNVADYRLGNVQPTESLLRTIDTYRLNIRRFVLVSSQAVTGPSPSADPIDEEYPMQPITDYGRSKMESEKIAQSYMSRIPITIVRPPAVYGPRDDGVYHFFRLINYHINLMIGNTDQQVNLVYVEDLARGIVQAAFSPRSAGKCYFLCEETSYRWSEFARLLGQVMNRKYITIKIPYFLIYLLSFILEKSASYVGTSTILNRQKMKELKQPFWVISPRRAQAELNYQTQVPLILGLEKTVRWYRDFHWL
jgi:nucleoside-diphosphate-sugar epimerase